jgi:DNA repair protein RecN (Recombination protein N)
MLKHLRVKNFALMDELNLNFEDGLTVITGETGAGKSMIVEAIAALCGEKLDETSIRTGNEYAEITGVFEPNEETIALLKKYNIDITEDFIIRRRIERGKRQFSYINDQIVSISRLKEITQGLVDLVGQHENQSLFNVTNHLKLLDRFAKTEELLLEYQKVYNQHRRYQAELEELEKLQKDKEQKLEVLKYDIEEIEKANLRVEEEDELVREKNLLLTGEKRASLIDEIIPRLYEAEFSVYENLATIKRLIEELTNLDPGPEIKNLSIMIENSISYVEEVYRQLIDYREHIDFSRERFEEVMERLDLIARLKKKHHRDINGILEYLKGAKEEFERLQNTEIEIEKIQNQIQNLSKQMEQLANELSKKRKAGAKIMEREIVKVISRLGMERAVFQVRFRDKKPDESGRDDVEFFISANPGEELKPLNRVGSGGEISRITLGLKAILSEVDHIPTVIFDEVDTGIGGRVAEAVGELLFNFSKNHQVICITHLPQISVFAEHHIMVKKEIKKDTTQVSVIKLNDTMRKMEIARMLGGKEITKKTIEHAEEILQRRKKNG